METKERKIVREKKGLSSGKNDESRNNLTTAFKPSNGGFTVRKTILLTGLQADRWNATAIRKELDELSRNNMTLLHKKNDDWVSKTIRLTDKQAEKWNPNFVRELLDKKSIQKTSVSSENQGDGLYKEGFRILASIFNSWLDDPLMANKMRERLTKGGKPSEEFELIWQLIEALEDEQ